MSEFGLILVVCSTFMHAGWNLLVRRRGCETVFIYRLLVSVVAVGLVPAIVVEATSPSLPSIAWVCMAVSGLCCGVYYFCLARAYASSDFTVVYPVARALPVMLVALGDVLRGRAPTTLGWVGILLVVGGCLLAPLRLFRDFSPRRYLNRAGVWIVLTAMGTVGYTLLDKLAAEAVQQGPVSAGRYEYGFFVASLVAYSILIRVFRGPCPESAPPGWKGPALAGALNFGCYWLVLWAYQLVTRASYVVALRQLSIVIGVVLAFAIYKEKGKAVRLTGTFLILAGLTLIALWGARPVGG